MRATLIIGAGPGGTGPLIWAAQNGALAAWLASGVTVIEGGAVMGGTLGRYIINSDSLGGVYLECLGSRQAREIFAPVIADPVCREVERMRRGFPPLALVDRYLRRVGSVLEQVVTQSPGGEFIPETTVRALRYRPDNSLIAEIASANGRCSQIDARTVILALGGRQRNMAFFHGQLMPGMRLADLPADKMVSSNLLMTADGRQRAAAIIARARSPRVVILGGSHSAYSAAWLLTHLMPELTFGTGDIRILGRRQPPIFYENQAAAEADNYPITTADICPRTQRVHRLGGLRGDGREMWRSLTGRPGCIPEERVRLVSLNDPALSPAALTRELNDAALIVPAFGYQARTVPVFDARGRRLRLSADQGRPAVGPDSRLLREDGQPLANLFCIGLGTGYRPSGSMGGEPSFAGQANSLWLYQNDIGGVIHQGVQRSLAEAPRARSVGSRPRPVASAATSFAKNDAKPRRLPFRWAH
jgi:hypothetical protein